jgi:molybdopterin converting factor small subunit
MSPQSGQLTLHVRFLARYAELVGTDVATLKVVAPARVEDVLAMLKDQFPGAKRLPDKPVCALNLIQVDLGTTVSDGDELAFLPPVAGG